MNNKGQSLVLFIIIIPLIIIMFVFVVDVSRLYYEKNRLDNINVLVLKKYSDKNDSEIERIIRKNDSDITNIEINHENNSLTLTKNIDVIFIGVLNKNKYEINSTYKIEDEKIIKIG